jgi:hypothetical protein
LRSRPRYAEPGQIRVIDGDTIPTIDATSA